MCVIFSWRARPLHSLLLQPGAQRLLQTLATLTLLLAKQGPLALLLDFPLHLNLALSQGNAKLAAGTNLLTLPDEQERDGAHQQTQTTQQTARARDRQLLEHLRGCQGQHSSEQRTAARGGGIGGGSKDLIGICEAVFGKEYSKKAYIKKSKGSQHTGQVIQESDEDH